MFCAHVVILLSSGVGRGKHNRGADRESLKLEFYALFWTATLILGKMT